MMGLETMRHLNTLHDEHDRSDLFRAFDTVYSVNDDKIESWIVDLSPVPGKYTIISQFDPRHFHLHMHPAGDESAGVAFCSDFDAIEYILMTFWDHSRLIRDSIDEHDSIIDVYDTIRTGRHEFQTAAEYISLLYGDPGAIDWSSDTGDPKYTGEDDRMPGLERIQTAAAHNQQQPDPLDSIMDQLTAGDPLSEIFGILQSGDPLSRLLILLSLLNSQDPE